MTDVPPGSGKFTRIPRTSGSPGVDVRAKLRDSVEAIEAFLHHAVASGRDAFRRNSPAYASGSMAVIRAAALFETGEFDDLLTETPADVRRALRTLRNIASHSGYRSMDDDILWLTLTRDLPPHVASWRRAAFD